MEKVHVIDKKQDIQNEHLEVYNQQLKDHIKRTKQLEDRVEPIETHVRTVSIIFKILGWGFGIIIGIGSLSGVIFSILRLMEYLTGH